MIELRNISRIYTMGSQPLCALKNVTLSIGTGQFISIMGTSGSGKSTLMNIIGCLDKPSSGQYLLNGAKIESYSEDELAEVRNRSIGFVFQQFNLLPRLSALENVLLPLMYDRSGSGNDRSALTGRSVKDRLRKERAERVLSMVGLGDRLHHRPNQLSGGQQQRVSIARALVNEPHILLADEPTGALDSATSKEIMRILSDLNQRGMTVVLVTHDSDVAATANRQIKLRDGSIISDS